MVLPVVAELRASKPALPEALGSDPRKVIYIQANIHAGEVEGKEAALPAPTKMLLATSSFMVNYWWLLLGMLGRKEQ